MGAVAVPLVYIPPRRQSIQTSSMYPTTTAGMLKDQMKRLIRYASGNMIAVSCTAAQPRPPCHST